MRAVGLETGWNEKQPPTLKVKIIPERAHIHEGGLVLMGRVVRSNPEGQLHAQLQPCRLAMLIWGLLINGLPLKAS